MRVGKKNTAFHNQDLRSGLHIRIPAERYFYTVGYKVIKRTEMTA